MPIVGQKVRTSSDNFGEMVQNGCLLVDKTMMIKEFFEGEKASLVTRMRRSGKTLNMSMLQHFFAAEVDGTLTKGMFNQFAIARAEGGEFVEKHQGQYPVIFVTFKDIKESSYGAAVNQIKVLIQKLYRGHEGILQSDKLSTVNKEIFAKYLSGSVSNEELQVSIEFLSEILHKSYSRKVIILIDEYDTPLTKSYEHKYLDQLSDFMRNMFSSAFKGNPHLEKGLLTGILRVSKNNMLSGLNNLEVYTLLDRNYDRYFGFTEEEVAELVAKVGVTDSLEKIKSFYNGYQIGNTVTYNPWSVMNYLAKKQLRPYWVLTSNDQLLKEVLTRSDSETRKKLESLMQGEEISGEVNVNLRYEDLVEKPNALWTLLVFCGYLTVTGKEPSLDRFMCKLRIPNEEVLIQYKSIFIDWLRERVGEHRYHSILKSLVQGKVEEFTRVLGDYLMESLSFMDVSGDKKSEIFYHGFVAALIASLRDTHYIDSNKESGLGRYDVIIIPKNTVNPVSIILEFKHTKRNQDIEAMAEVALKQIDELKYSAQIKRYPHIQKIIKVGMAFCEKSMVSAYQEEEKLTRKTSEPRLIKHQRDEDVLFADDEHLNKRQRREKTDTDINQPVITPSSISLASAGIFSPADSNSSYADVATTSAGASLPNNDNSADREQTYSRKQ